MKQNKTVGIRFFEKNLNFMCLVIFFLLSSPLLAVAEKVKPLNPDCDVCPVVISYDFDEARNILGKKGMSRILKLGTIGKKTVKIDLDGVKVIGTEKDSDDGYELLVFVYQHLIVINSILDGSSIKLRTDFNALIKHRAINQWNPEIQLSPSNGYKIKKSDELDAAWDKMKKSRMYGFVNNSIDHRTWDSNLTKFLLMVLDASLKK